MTRGGCCISDYVYFMLNAPPMPISGVAYGGGGSDYVLNYGGGEGGAADV